MQSESARILLERRVRSLENDAQASDDDVDQHELQSQVDDLRRKLAVITPPVRIPMALGTHQRAFSKEGHGDSVTWELRSVSHWFAFEQAESPTFTRYGSQWNFFVNKAGDTHKVQIGLYVDDKSARACFRDHVYLHRAMGVEHNFNDAHAVGFAPQGSLVRLITCSGWCDPGRGLGHSTSLSLLQAIGCWNAERDSIPLRAHAHGSLPI